MGLPFNSVSIICGAGLSRVASPLFKVVLCPMEGLTKNKYIGRTFIQPTQKQRLNAVRLKLNANKALVAGKSVVMVDDSIVRGTTSGKIVQLLKDSGAKEVHAGTKEKDGQVVTAGGRVLGVTAVGSSIAQAKDEAYVAVDKIHFANVHYRKDIAWRALK